MELGSAEKYICEKCLGYVYPWHSCPQESTDASSIPYNPIPIIPTQQYERDAMLDLIAAFIEVRNSFAALKMNMEYLSEQMEEFKKILDEMEFSWNQ